MLVVPDICMMCESSWDVNPMLAMLKCYNVLLLVTYYIPSCSMMLMSMSPHAVLRNSMCCLPYKAALRLTVKLVSD